jgi:hypothetical protein
MPIVLPNATEQAMTVRIMSRTSVAYRLPYDARHVAPNNDLEVSMAALVNASEVIDQVKKVRQARQYY